VTGGGGTARGRQGTARAALNRRIVGLQPGARLLVATADGERTLAVEYRGPPEWVAGGDGGCVLTLTDGGEAYVLRAYPDDDTRRPWLYGPRGRLQGRPVVGVRVEATGESITAERTAADLFPRVARYGGR